MKDSKISWFALLLALIACFLPLSGGKSLGGSVVEVLQTDFQNGFYVGGSLFVDADRAITAVDSTVSDDLVVGDDVTITGNMTYKEEVESVAAINVLTIAESGKTFYLNTSGASTTLPAVASSAGVTYRFVVGSALSGDATINSAEGDNLEGSLIVAGAVVDCDAGDTLTFVADGENLGDFVQVRSNGSKWYVTQSNALTTAKLTCSG